MTNGVGNVAKKVQLHKKDKSSGKKQVQLDHADVGEKTIHDNKHLYIQGIQSTWTPIKPITTQLAVSRNRTGHKVILRVEELLTLILPGQYLTNIMQVLVELQPQRDYIELIFVNLNSCQF